MHEYHVAATSLTLGLHFQGVDIPDVLTVMQWRVPKDLNTLMQCFGHAGQEFSLQAVAILLAELKWFLEDHQKRHTWKRKQIQKRKKKVSRPRTDAGARTGNFSLLDNASGSEGDTSTNAGNKNNSIPNGDREGASDVEEAIKSISITAGGTGRSCKQITDKVMWLFINAHLLCGRKCCCHFHSNHYYNMADIRKLFNLDSKFHFANHFPVFVFSCRSTMLCPLHA